MKPAIFELPPGSQLKFPPLSSNETTHVQHAEAAKLCFPRVGRWQAEMHCRVKFLCGGEGEFTNTTGTQESWQIMFSSHSDRAAPEHAHSFFCQKVQGQCKGGILKDRIILGRAGSGWVQKTGWTKLSRLTFLKQAARFDFLKSKVVPMRGTQGMFWTSGSIVYALLCGNLWQPQDVEKQSCIQVNLC